MADPLSYTVESSARHAPALFERAFRTIFLVASVWLVLGSGINMLTMGKVSPLAHRLQLFALGALLVSLAIYSLALPLYYVLRRAQPVR